METEIPKVYQGTEPTKINRADYEKQFPKVKEQILKEKPELAGKNNLKKLNKEAYKRMGFPYWKKDGSVTDFGKGFFYQINQGKARWRGPRLKTQAKAGGKRQQSIDAANALLDPAKVKEGQALQKQIQKKPGRTGDHKFEVQEFGPTQELLEEEYAKGAITDAEYKKRKQIFIDANPGDHVDNFEDLHWKTNEIKRKEIKAKNVALEKMEKANPSLRHLDPKYKQAMEIAEQYKVSKVVDKAAKATKPLRKVLRYVPIVGGGMVLLNAKAQAEEAIQNPTWQNKVQAGIAGADAALEGVELATGGVAGLVTTPLQIGLMIADQMVHQTEDSFTRNTQDWDARRASRRGQS